MYCYIAFKLINILKEANKFWGDKIKTLMTQVTKGF